MKPENAESPTEKMPERIWLSPIRSSDGYFVTCASDDLGAIEYVLTAGVSAAQDERVEAIRERGAQWLAEYDNNLAQLSPKLGAQLESLYSNTRQLIADLLSISHKNQEQGEAGKDIVCDLDCPFDLPKGHLIRDHPTLDFCSAVEKIRKRRAKMYFASGVPTQEWADIDTLLSILEALRGVKQQEILSDEEK